MLIHSVNSTNRRHFILITSNFDASSTLQDMLLTYKLISNVTPFANMSVCVRACGIETTSVRACVRACGDNHLEFRNFTYLLNLTNIYIFYLLAYLWLIQH